MREQAETGQAAQGALVAMSGGVDSSVAACLALEAGYRCLGVTMRLFSDNDRDIEDAASAASALGIPHEPIDCMADFREKVINRFIATYEAGGTPNPCVDCNRHLKFGRLLDTARERGLGFVVTGHYARIERGESGRWLLRKGADPERDQSYVLCMLTQEQLAHTLLPLGVMTKARVRELAAARGLANASKRDSQDICFVPDGDYAAFMERYTGRRSPPGDFVDGDGRVLGRHRGIVRYTVGQRKGLGIAGPAPLYVEAIHPDTNTITLTHGEGLLARAVVAQDFNLISVPSLERPMTLKAKVRYRQEERPAVASLTPEGLRVEFLEPQRAPAAGQTVMLCDGDVVVGGGIISAVERL